MYKKIFFTLAIIAFAMMFSSCHKKGDKGLNFESTYRTNLEMVKLLYPADSVKTVVICGCLSQSFEDIVKNDINMDTVYFTNVFVVMQIGNDVLEFWNSKDGVDTNWNRNGYWDDTYPLVMTDDLISADSAARKYVNYLKESGEPSVPGNFVVLRSPFEIGDSLNPYYLFGYDSVYSIMDKCGKVVK